MRYYLKIVVFLLIFASTVIWLNFFYTNKYSVKHNKAWVYPVSSSDGYQKYVIYECDNRQLCGGLVDRFKAIINAFAWSQFTQRALIVNISKPCYFEYLMMPNEIDWNLNLKKLVEIGRLPANYTFHDVRHLDDFGFKNELAKMDVLNYQKDKDVISLYTNIEWISAYSRNK